MIKRIYIDTSVFGGKFDKEFKEDTETFFNELLRKKIKIVLSEVHEIEIYRAPSNVKSFYERSQSN